MSLTVQERAGRAADAVIAAGEKAELKKMGTAVAVVTGVVTVPTGTVVGAAGGALARGFTGYADAYRREPKLKESLMNSDKTILAAGIAGGVGLALGLGAMALGADVSGVETIGAGAGAAMVTFVGAGAFNGLAAAFVGAGKGAAKGFDAGIGAAKVVGGAAQVATDETIKFARKVCKDAIHVVDVTAHNAVEATRETVEDVRVVEADALQAAANIAKERANRVANGGPRFDKDGKHLPDHPPVYKKYD